MRGKHLLTILLLILAVTVVICFCGCSDAASPVSGTDPDPAISVDDPQRSETEPQQPSVETPDPADKDLQSADNPDPDPADSGSKKPAEPADPNKPSANVTVADPSAPWKDFDMYGIPEVLDVRKKDDGDLFVLVNKLHAVSKDYKPTDMVVMDNKLTTWENLELKSDAYDAYLELYRDAKDEGFSLKVCSAYRTYSTQKTLYANAVKNKGQKTADIRSAYAGRSEHHTGYALDITSKSMGWGLKQDFADYPDGKWINDHCSEYGFIIRYPKDKTEITGYDYEPWHLRYVGVEAAAEITEQGITLEEYLGR